LFYFISRARDCNSTLNEMNGRMRERMNEFIMELLRGCQKIHKMMLNCENKEKTSLTLQLNEG